MSDVPVVIPTYIGYAPRADGKVSDQMWSSAPCVSDFRLVNSGELAGQRTQVRICYDRSTLYILFECFEDDMGRVRTEFVQDGSSVWQDDSVEIWISPYAVADPAKSHQFVVNAAGAKTHIRPDWERSQSKWRAAVVRSTDRWIAEIVIPFDTLRPFGRNEVCWRINFCRNEFPHSESSSWSPVQEHFSACSCFGRLVPPKSAYRFCTFRGEPVLLTADDYVQSGSEPVGEDVAKVRCSGYIVPEPQEVHNRLSKGRFSIGMDTCIVVDADAEEKDLWAIEDINATIEKLGGRRLAIVRSDEFGSEVDSAHNVIIVGECARNRLLWAVCNRDCVRMPRSRYSTGAYVIDALTSRVVVTGTSNVDTYYGVQTLKQLIRRDEDGNIYVSAVNIRDFSRFAFRAVHLLTSRDALSYISKLIANVLAPLKINHIVLQTDKIAWQSHPEIVDASNYMPREDVVKLIEIARRHHIKITPMVPSPGHMEWAFANGCNLDIAEDSEIPYCYCMSNPKSHEFIFSVIDEAIELFGHPECFHVGRNEFDVNGKMPCDDRCKSIGKEKLYIQDTLKIYEHLKSRGCKMMMWGDVLTRPGYRDMIGDLPNDIIITDWHYAPRADYPSVEFYQSHGFPIVGCTWYDPRNIYTYANNASRFGVDGMMQVTRTKHKTEQEILRDYPEQVYAYVLFAAWTWNPVRPALDKLTYRPDCVFNKLWNDKVGDACPDFYVVRLDRYFNISRVDSGRAIGWLGIGRGNDLREMPNGLLEMEGTPFWIAPARLDVPAAVILGGSAICRAFPKRVDNIEINSNLTALNFLHGCAFASDRGANVAEYVVHYEDGKTQTIELVYSYNIYAWDDQSTAMSYGFAWRTCAQDGRLVGVSELRWVNPRPDVKVTSIDFVSKGTEASPFLLAITLEICK